MNAPLYRTIARTALCLAAAGILASCGTGEPPAAPPRVVHKKPAKPKPVAPEPEPEVALYTAEAYVWNLAMAQFPKGNRIGNFAVVDAYASQPAHEAERLNLLILQYTRKGDAQKQQVAFPLSSPPEFSGLPALMQRLNVAPYTLHDLRVASADISPSIVLALPDELPNDAETVIIAQEQRLLESATSLSAPDSIRMQLQLLAFFIQHRHRDAAYLTADNVKKAIAALPHEQPTDVETIDQLSQELEALESDLRKAMPFTL